MDLNKDGEACIVAKLKKKKKLHKCLMNELSAEFLGCKFCTNFEKESICKNISKTPCKYRDDKFNRKLKNIGKEKSKEEK